MPSTKKDTGANEDSNVDTDAITYRDGWREAMDIAKAAFARVDELKQENAALRAEVAAFRAERAAAEIWIPDALTEKRMVLLAIIAWATHHDAWYSNTLRAELAGDMSPAMRDALEGSLERLGARTGAERRRESIEAVRHWMRTGLRIGDRVGALPDVEERLTDDQISDAIYMWRRGRGRPSAFDETMCEMRGLPRNRDEYFATLVRQLKLGRVSAGTLHRDWAVFVKKNGLR